MATSHSFEPPKRVVIVGAGAGGLAAAVRLLAAGNQVTVVERAATPGGKMRQISVGGQLFDGGPSVLTMPWVLDDLFATAGLRSADFLRLTPLDPVCRHFFADGTRLDLFADDNTQKGDGAYTRTREEIARVIGSQAAAQYLKFRRRAQMIYNAVERPFLRSALPKNPLAFALTHKVSDVFGLLRIDAHRSLWKALNKHFDDERLRVLFARYATYSGANPFLAPATLSVIPHVELAFGVFSVEGGMYRVAEALAELVVRLGGTLRFSADVERVELDEKEQHAVAVHVGGERIVAEVILVNCDVAQLNERLLAGTRRGSELCARFSSLPPSLSAQLNLSVVEGAGTLPLVHHNVFFSADYPAEFVDLESGPPRDPTIYLCNPDFRQERQRWFFLVNAPALSKNDVKLDETRAEAAHCRTRIEAALRRHDIDWPALRRAEQTVTPHDFATLFPHSRGALYGAAASSRMAAFKRPPNRVPGVANLYCIGGSTHPGAGVPMAMLSAEIVCKMLETR